MYKLTAKEEEVMERIWQLGTCTPKEVVALYPESERPHINSVANAFQSLEKKGYLTHRPLGRGFLYEPIIGKQEYGRSKLRSFADRFLDGSIKEIVSFFAQEQELTPDDLKDIIKEIEGE